MFADAKVTHVDAGLGLLLRLPMAPEPAAAFVHVSNLADDKLSAAEVAKKYKVSGMVKLVVNTTTTPAAAEAAAVDV